jgi:hypothetical protein
MYRRAFRQINNGGSWNYASGINVWLRVDLSAIVARSDTLMREFQMKNLAKLAFAAALLSSAAVFPAVVSAAPSSPVPLVTQGDTEIITVALTRRQRIAMHRRAMRSNRSVGSNRINRANPKDMTNSDAGAVGNTRAPLSQPGPISRAKDMSTTDTGAPGNTRAPTSAPGPRSPAKDMSTSDTPK